MLLILRGRECIINEIRVKENEHKGLFVSAYVCKYVCVCESDSIYQTRLSSFQFNIYVQK